MKLELNYNLSMCSNRIKHFFLANFVTSEAQGASDITQGVIHQRAMSLDKELHKIQ